MTLDPRFFICPPLDQWFVDKDTGLPLAGGTIAFYRDSARTTPKAIYQLTGAPPNYIYTALPSNVITLSGVGTIQNDSNDNIILYLFPYEGVPEESNGKLDLYFIVCRNSGGIQQWTREAINNVTAIDKNGGSSNAGNNQLSNTQFTRVFINEDIPTEYAVSGETGKIFSLGPNWDFVISGTGSVIVDRVPISGNDNVITNPPYALDITVQTGVTSCLLRQRLSVNSGVWSSTEFHNTFLSGTIIVRNEGVGSSSIEMFYKDSSGNAPARIIDASFGPSYVQIKGGTPSALPLSTNTMEGINGFVDIYLSIPQGSHIRISSVQVIPTFFDAGPDFLDYQENSSNREQALMGDYFIPQLEEKRIPSFLVGWDFPLNPMQTIGQSGSISTSTSYICDQTIAKRGTTGNVTFQRNGVTQGLNFITFGSDDSFHIMQYLDGKQAKKILGAPLSAKISAFKFGGDDVTMRVYMFRAPSTAPFPTLPTSIGNLNVDGTFVLTAAGWTEIPRSGLPTAQANLKSIIVNADINNDNTYSFTGWKITEESEISDTDKYAIVITFHYVDAATSIVIDSCGVCLGNIPTLPAIQTQQQVLTECEHFFESTYPIGTPPGTNFGTAVPYPGYLYFIQGAVIEALAIIAFPVGFYHDWNTVKRRPPLITTYSPATGGVNLSSVSVYNQGVATFTNDSINSTTTWDMSTGTTAKRLVAIANTAVPLGNGGASADKFYSRIIFHCTSDARPGVVA